MNPRSVLITGANRGLGLEFVRQFLALPDPPSQVFAGCRNPADAKDLQAVAKPNSTVTVLQLDVADEASIESCISVIGNTVGNTGLNLLINNAGRGAMDKKIQDVTSESMMELYRVNTVGPLLVAKACMPLLKTAADRDKESPMSCSRAAVINISTGLASIAENSSGGHYSYRCSKAALNMFTTNLSLECKNDGILATVIHPGWVKTDMGGPSALMETSISIGHVMSLMGKLHGEDGTGKFYHCQGREMPW